jgi:hypothetical protein
MYSLGAETNAMLSVVYVMSREPATFLGDLPHAHRNNASPLELAIAIVRSSCEHALVHLLSAPHVRGLRLTFRLRT